MNDSAALPDHQQVEIERSGLNAAAYEIVRQVGATHDEVMEAHFLGADLATYALFRSDHPHRRALDEAGAPNSPTHQEAGRLGVTDAELAEVRASHRATVDAYWSGITGGLGYLPHSVPLTRVGDYLTARRAGLVHDDALQFAMRVALLVHRPDSRDLTLWARCRASGLPSDRLFCHAPRSHGGQLSGNEVEVLQAVLFAARAVEPSPVAVDEMIWLASRAGTRRIDVVAYLEARVANRSARSSLRRAVKKSWTGGRSHRAR